VLTALLALGLAAATQASDAAQSVARGREIYRTACMLCHGRLGIGNDEWVNPVRPPDLADCLANTAEPDEQWHTIVAHGGPARGLSSVMPAFGDAYSQDEIDDVVAYLRALCTRADRYPPGELNFRRLLATGKAYPESEVVLAPSLTLGAPQGQGEAEIDLSYEDRLGPRFQYELTLPVRPMTAHDEGSVGRLELEGKYVLGFDKARLQIVSAGLTLTLPTDDTSGLGFEPFFAYGKAWRSTTLQARIAGSIPSNGGFADAGLIYAVGVSHGFGPSRVAWTPAIEWFGEWNPRSGEHQSSLIAEASKPLSRLGHVIGCLGVQAPLAPRSRSWRLQAYVLWDFGDGPLWKGW